MYQVQRLGLTLCWDTTLQERYAYLRFMQWLVATGRLSDDPGSERTLWAQHMSAAYAHSPSQAR